jgi:hypothetical protein
VATRFEYIGLPKARQGFQIPVMGQGDGKIIPGGDEQGRNFDFLQLFYDVMIGT